VRFDDVDGKAREGEERGKRRETEDRTVGEV
jgi:hypothetical protein